MVKNLEVLKSNLNFINIFPENNNKWGKIRKLNIVDFFLIVIDKNIAYSIRFKLG